MTDGKPANAEDLYQLREDSTDDVPYAQDVYNGELLEKYLRD